MREIKGGEYQPSGMGDDYHESRVLSFEATRANRDTPVSLWPHMAPRRQPLDLASFFAGLAAGAMLCPLAMVGLWAVTR